MRLLTAVILAAYLLMNPDQAVLRAREAMNLWAASVAPALIPFLALLPALTDAQAQNVYRRLFSVPMRRLFALPGEAAGPAVIGLAAGSPAGARAVLRAYRSGAVSARDVRVLSAFSTGAGSAFIVSSVGAGMFKSARAGAVLLAGAWIGAVLTAVTVRFLLKGDDVFCASGDADIKEPGAIREAVMGATTVLGYMMVFRVFAGGLPEDIYALMEISGGCLICAERGSVVRAAFVIGTGGACMLAQNYRILKEAGIRLCELAFIKGLSGVFSAIASCVLAGMNFPEAEISPDTFAFSCMTAGAMAVLCVTGALINQFQRHRR